MGRKKHPEPLTPAEQRVLEEVRTGATNAEIAVRLGLSINTVKYHVANMLSKLEAEDRKELAAWSGATGRSWRRFGMWIGVGAVCVGVAVVAVALVLTRGSAPPEPHAFVAALLVDTDGDPISLVVRQWPEESTVMLVDREGVVAIAPTWSPDGDFLAWLEFDKSSLTSKGVIWERRSGRRVEIPLALESFIGFAWSPDSELLAAVGEQLSVWRPDGTVVFEGERESSDSRRVGSTLKRLWSPDGKLLAFSFNAHLLIYDRMKNDSRRFTSTDLGISGLLEFVGILGWLSDHELAAVNTGGGQFYEIDVVAGTTTVSQDPDRVEEAIATAFNVDLHERFPDAEYTRVDTTADGRGWFGGWADRTDHTNTGLLVGSGSKEVPIDLKNIEPVLRNLDVVLVGDWPEN